MAYGSLPRNHKSHEGFTMSLKIVFEVTDEYGASEAVKYLGRMFPNVALPAYKPEPVVAVVSAFAKECQTIAAEIRHAGGAGTFTAAELAADAVPAPPAYVPPPPLGQVDPATVGFGLGVPPASAIPSHELVTGATSVPPPPNPAAGVPLDSSGLPHDQRIHASTRTTIKDGTWKKKPRVTDEEVAAVMAELRGTMAIPAYVVGPNETVMPSGNTVVTNFAPPVPVAPAPPVPVAPGTPSTFPDFIAWVSPIVNSGKLTVLDVNAAALGLGLVNGSGVGSIQLLANRPDLVPAAHAALSAKVAQ